MMRQYLRWFAVAGLVYLVLAALAGLLGQTRALEKAGNYAASNLSLLGSLASFVFAGCYWAMPKLGKAKLRYPRLVPVQFWLHNLALWGMVLFRGMSLTTDQSAYNLFFTISVVGIIASFALFVGHLWATLSTPASGHNKTSGPSA